MGRGLGSGKGKTGGRGAKGQKARGKLRLGFVGGGLPLYRKLPLQKGMGNPKMSEQMVAVNLAALSVFKSGSVIDAASLVEKGLLTKRDLKSTIKILGTGEIKVSLTVNLLVSESARKKIEGAGGKVGNE